MNDDEAFSRVRVRKQLLPLMKSFNNRIVEALSRTAALLNEDADALSDQAGRLLEAGRSPSQGRIMKPSRRFERKCSVASAGGVASTRAREWILRSRGDLGALKWFTWLALKSC